MICWFIPTWLKLVLAATVAAIFIAGSAYQFGKYSERQSGLVIQLQKDIQAERERGKDDAQTRSLSNYNFCMHALRRRGVRSREECEQLRGLAAE